MTSVISGLLLFTLGFLCGAAAMGLLRRRRYTRDLTEVPDYLQRPPMRPSAAPAAPYPSSPPADLHQQVVMLLQRRRKLEAIKIYKDATGVGLKEAKDAVEAVERTLPH